MRKTGFSPSSLPPAGHHGRLCLCASPRPAAGSPGPLPTPPRAFARPLAHRNEATQLRVGSQREERGRGRRTKVIKKNERREGSGEMKDQGARRRAGQAGRPALLAQSTRRGPGAPRALTRPEQHGPVEPRGLGGAPRPLARPLRHAPARPTAERPLRTRSAAPDPARRPGCLRAGDANRGPDPAADRVTAAAGAPGAEAPRRAGQGSGARAGVPRARRGSGSGVRTPGPGVPGPKEMLVSHPLFSISLASGLLESYEQVCGSEVASLGSRPGATSL